MEEHSISARHGLSPLKMLMWILSSFSSARVTELTNKVSTLTRELSDSVASLKRSRMESDQPSGVFRLVLVCVCVSVCVCV